jgi:PQQ-like domain/Vacuolar protein sorting-associated protein 62
MKKSRLFLSLLLTSACALALLTSRARAWQTAVTPGNGTAFAVAIDAAGDVISAGNLDSYTVAKMSGATGEVKWRYSPGSGVSFTPSDIAVDSNGDVFVAVTGQRFITKLSGANGTVLWTRFLGGTSNAFQSQVNAVRVDHNGDVVTAGSIGGLFNVNKLDGRSGDEFWHYEREGLGMAVAVAPSGDVAAAGVMDNNFGVVKLHGDSGLEAWQREINGAGNFTDLLEEANSVAVDADGSVIAAGATSNIVGNERDFTVAKYTSGGDLQWVLPIDGGWCEINDHGQQVCQSNDEARAVALGSDGSVFAAGYMQEDANPLIPGANEHFNVLKISRDGQLIWNSPAEEAPFGQEYTRGRAMSLSVDGTDDVVAVGQHGERFTAVKFTGGGSRAGQRVWFRQIGSVPTQGNSCIGWEVATDAGRDVVAVGNTPAPDQLPLYTVVKLRGVDGADYFPAPSPTPTPDFEGALHRHVPVLKFNSGEKYFPLSVEAITDSPGNTLQRPLIGNRDLVIAKSPPSGKSLTLNIDFLGARYPSPVTLTPDEQDEVDERNDWEDAAFALQLQPRYADRIYGRIQYGLDDMGRTVAWLQYWFFYYYNDYHHQTRTGDRKLDLHEGDWEMIQIALDHNARPMSAVYAEHDGGSQCGWTEVELAGPDNERPVVYVARGSHASYFHAGEKPLEKVGVVYGLDLADGAVSRPEPTLEILKDLTPDELNPDRKVFYPGWLNWPGRWGGTRKSDKLKCTFPLICGDSPRGPKFQGKKWEDPRAFAADTLFDCK